MRFHNYDKYFYEHVLQSPDMLHAHTHSHLGVVSLLSLSAIVDHVAS
jgi:hypothetical protein